MSQIAKTFHRAVPALSCADAGTGLKVGAVAANEQAYGGAGERLLCSGVLVLLEMGVGVMSRES